MFSLGNATSWRLFLILHLCLVLALGLWLLRQTRPVALPDASGQRIACVSYSPFHRPGSSPLEPGAVVPEAWIRQDLAALSQRTGCVRIYAVDKGLAAVPVVAESLGMKVILGAWIGSDEAENRRQLDRAVALAMRYPDTVRALLVGNEVLLRRELPPQRLRELLLETRARVSVPVSYADVWEFWLRQPQLADAVDFVTVHILPFWEDEPVAVEQAVAHVAAVRERVAAALGRPVLIGESGWPAAGRQRRAAVPGRLEQTRFVREFLLAANAGGWDYNLIEAFDQPWKRRLEGTVGGYWGLYDDSFTPRVTLAGPLAARDGAGALPLAAMAAALALAALARLAGRPVLQTLALAAAGLWLGLVGGLLIEHARLAWRDAAEGLLLALAAATGPLWLALFALSPRLGGGGRWALEWLRLALLFCAAVAALWLAVDPRYRDFPLWMYSGVAPALLFAGRAERDSRARELRICAVVLAVAGALRLLPEPGNGQAVAWLAACLVLAAGGWAAGQQQQRQ